MTVPVPLSRKDQAQQYIDEIQTQLENDNLDQAAEIVIQLSTHIAEWQRITNIQAARAWLDDALQDDLLAFDSTTAQEHLEKWANAAQENAENPELDSYQERVEKQIQEKNTALQIRGVIAHCTELLTKAREMEQSEEPPNPEFMMKQYYRKARGVAAASKANFGDHIELEQLVQRVERTYNQKATAATIYPMALEDHKYSNALHNLGQLADDGLIPRYTATDDGTGTVKLNYQQMIPAAQARQELTQFARSWAEKTAQEAIQTSERFLAAHEPQEAIDQLDLGENVSKFLDEELKAALETAKTKATTDLRNREIAEERISKANELASQNSLEAWDEYAGAYHTYQWVSGLETTRQAIISGLQNDLNALLKKVDSAFHDKRDMQRVRTLCQQAQNQYTNKDAALDEQLKQFSEFEEMVQSYEEYVQTATEILEKVRAAISEDAHEANELLSQVESYPEFVLETFDDIFDLRQNVNKRLNADHEYSVLYPALFNDTVSEVTQAIESAKTVAQEYPDDTRFTPLVQALQYHMAFVSAQQQAQNGAIQQAQQLLAPVLNNPKHPDFEAAQALNQELTSAQQQEEASSSEEES